MKDIKLRRYRHSTTFASALGTQLRVIGATILRELHTRFGRENIGYLWFVLEPTLLASGIAVIHVVTSRPLRDNMDVAPFYITGYCLYMLFRSNVNRASSVITSNRTLLYHRPITLADLVIARSLLEAAAIILTLYLLLGACAVLHLGHLPGRPLLLFLSVALMSWISTGLAMIICAASEKSAIVDRLVHPITYLILPASGLFFVLDWLPSPYRDILAWFPITQIEELAREGQFANFHSQYINIAYLLGVCSITTLIGMSWLRVVRSEIQLP